MSKEVGEMVRSRDVVQAEGSARTEGARRATSWSGTTRPGVSRSLGIKRRSRRARSMSYARRHSTNVCPGNRVRYMVRSASSFQRWKVEHRR